MYVRHSFFFYIAIDDDYSSIY